ncbi:hypothetical protein CPB83DRAFT_847921, partial [Crepidotus variabilis]
MTLQPPSLMVNRVIIGGFYSVASLTSVLRLIYRWKRQRLWWDDFWALMALLSYSFVAMVCLILPMQFLSQRSANVQVFRFLGVFLGTTLTLWAARLSLAVSIVRLVPDSSFRRFAKAIAVFFGILFLGLAIQKLFFCCGTQWKEIGVCKITDLTTYLSLATDAIGDCWLVGAPAYMLSNTKLSSHYRLLLLLIFSASIFVIFSSVVHYCFILTNQVSYVSIVAHIELGLAITVSNLLVLGTWLYRVVRRSIRHPPSPSEGDCAEKSRTSQSRQYGPARNLMDRLSNLPQTRFTLTTMNAEFEVPTSPCLFSTFEIPPSHPSHIRSGESEEPGLTLFHVKQTNQSAYPML